MITYSELESKRRRWKPFPMTWTPFEINDSGVPDALLKSIALGLELELPVAEWVAAATKTELPISQEGRVTLGRNIADEAVHFKGFTYASQTYPIPEDIMEEAKLIGQAWNDNNSHPLEKAAVAESGVFLCSLFLMSMFGGRSLANLAVDVASDEWRHVLTNWGLLEEIGYQRSGISSSLDNLRLESIAFVFGGVNIRSLGIDLDFMRDQSDLLLLDGYAPELEEMSEHAVYTPPFEVHNSRLY